MLEAYERLKRWRDTAKGSDAGYTAGNEAFAADVKALIGLMECHLGATAGCTFWDLKPGEPYFVKEVSAEEHAAAVLDTKGPDGWIADGAEENGRYFLLICTDSAEQAREVARLAAAWNSDDDVRAGATS